MEELDARMEFNWAEANTKNFVEFPEWFQHIETVANPIMDNRVNEMVEHNMLQAGEHVGRLNLVRDVGIEFAIQRYGLHPPLHDESESEEEEDFEELEEELIAQPSTSPKELVEDTPQPSTSRSPHMFDYASSPKRLKIDADADDVLLAAIETAIADRGISTLHSR